MDLEDTQTVVCGRCGLIISIGSSYEDKVAFSMCLSCANREAEKYYAEKAALYRLYRAEEDYNNE